MMTHVTTPHTHTPLCYPPLTVLLHDHARDHVFERLVQSRELLDAVLEAARSPLADLSAGDGKNYDSGRERRF
jgi:hypothetical protein